MSLKLVIPRKVVPDFQFGGKYSVIRKYFFSLNPLPNDKILDWSKLKQIADSVLKCIQNEI